MLAAAGGAAFTTAASQTPPPVTPAWFELRHFQMRNARTNQVQRTSKFISEAYAPAARRAGVGPVGIFSAVIGPESPFLLVVSGHSSPAAMQASMEKMDADAEYQKQFVGFNSNPDPAYVRMETTLLRCFDAVPAIERGTAPVGNATRVFEMRTYESDNELTLKKKIKMFADGEIAIFRKCGLAPVFFGQAMVGPNLPRITYMVAFDSLAARENAWSVFGSDPDWQKLRVLPGLADADIVSNISNIILKPVAGSDIR